MRVSLFLCLWGCTAEVTKSDFAAAEKLCAERGGLVALNASFSPALWFADCVDGARLKAKCCTVYDKGDARDQRGAR